MPGSGVVGIGQDRHMPRRQPVPAGQRPGGRVTDLQQPAGRMMPQLFPDIPLGGAGPVQAQPLTQVPALPGTFVMGGYRDKNPLSRTVHIGSARGYQRGVCATASGGSHGPVHTQPGLYVYAPPSPS